MEITLKTNEPYEIEGLMNAGNFRSALCDMGNYLRSAFDKGDSEGMVCISDIYEKFIDTMIDNNVNRDIVGF